MKNYVVPKVTLSATDGVYIKGLPIEAPIPTTVEVEFGNHPEWFDVTGDPFGKVEVVKEVEPLPETPKPKAAPKKKTATTPKKSE